VTFAELLERFKKTRALVVGDLMLDEYIFGRATRISPEAPVMVVRQSSTRAVPGGAANVAGDMVAMGAKTRMIGVIGADLAGQTLAASLAEWGVDDEDMIVDSSRPTTRKTRVVANHSHQVLRIDHEEEAPISGNLENAVLERALKVLPDVDVVLISDYTKGAVTTHIIQEIVKEGRRIGVPVVANPKPNSLPFYAGASLVSLNQYEVGDFLGLGRGVPHDQAEQAAIDLKQRLKVDHVLITLGASGMAAASKSAFSVPAVQVEVYDEAGAGDTVVATVALGIGAHAFSKELLHLAAQTAGSVVQRVGVTTPNEADLARIAAMEL
jgi:D-beta-D-heptose 7-phosphate kinase/D-beta-D-heptose 1-phosphate adenosyltransferase